MWRSVRWDRRPKRKWRQRRPTPRASVTPLRQQHSQQQPVALLVTGAKGAKGGADAGTATEVDNLTAGGFFGWMGREQLGAERVTARAFPAPRAAEGP